MYPASYMWGKVLPELTRFLLKKPFGVDAPFAGMAMANHVIQGFQLEVQTNQQLRDFLEQHPQTVRFFEMMVPGTPWDIPVNGPPWMRHFMEQEMENRLREQRGLKPVQNDLSRIIGDTANYAVGAGRAAIQWGAIQNEWQNNQEETVRQSSLLNYYANTLGQTSRGGAEEFGDTTP
jgi:hypothetical protein